MISTHYWLRLNLKQNLLRIKKNKNFFNHHHLKDMNDFCKQYEIIIKYKIFQSLIHSGMSFIWNLYNANFQIKFSRRRISSRNPQIKKNKRKQLQACPLFSISSFGFNGMSMYQHFNVKLFRNVMSLC